MLIFPPFSLTGHTFCSTPCARGLRAVCPSRQSCHISGSYTHAHSYIGPGQNAHLGCAPLEQEDSELDAPDHHFNPHVH
eukprot:1161205-Pelagomonas_calceolata.AAC.1